MLDKVAEEVMFDVDVFELPCGKSDANLAVLVVRNYACDGTTKGGKELTEMYDFLRVGGEGYAFGLRGGEDDGVLKRA